MEDLKQFWPNQQQQHFTVKLLILYSHKTPPCGEKAQKLFSKPAGFSWYHRPSTAGTTFLKSAEVNKQIQFQILWGEMMTALSFHYSQTMSNCWPFLNHQICSGPTTAVTAGSIPCTTVYWSNDAHEPGWVQVPEKNSEVTYPITFIHLHQRFSCIYTYATQYLALCTWIPESVYLTQMCPLRTLFFFVTGCICICLHSVSVCALLRLPPLLPYHRQASISRPPFLHSSNSHVGQQGICGC